MKNFGILFLLASGLLSLVVGMERMWGIAAPLDMLLVIIGNCVVVYVLCEIFGEEKQSD
jgi:hypothetical protein